MDDSKSSKPPLPELANGAAVPSPAERELSEVNAFLDAIVENIPHMIFVKDAERLAFQRFNRAGEELLGLSRQVLLGKTDADFWPAEQVEHFVHKDRETLARGKLVEIEEEPIETARGRRWLRTKKIPLRDARGEPTFLLGISEDITEQKRVQEELARAKAELEERVAERTAELSRLNAELLQEVSERKSAEAALRRSEEQLRQAHKMEAVGLLAGGVAHDFNNLLTVIVGYAGALLNDVALTEEVKDDLAQINKAAEQASVLTRQLLTFSRRQLLKPEVLDLNARVRDLEKMLRRLVGENITLHVRLAPRPIWVKADAGQIEQVILNLVVNARDAIEAHGEIIVESAQLDVTEPGRGTRSRVLLSVSDTGHGMDEATRSRIFEPFFTTKERGRGTGLGLATVYGIVEQSGGVISVLSEPGAGSTFNVYLPSTDEKPSLPPSREAVPRSSPGIVVLLVEDDELVRNVARRTLAQHGMQVVEAASGARAIEIFRENPGRFSVVVTDVVMPGMSGPTMVEALLPLCPELRVLFISGYTDNELVREVVSERGFAFLQKPFAPLALVSRVQELAGAAALSARS